VVKIDAKGFLAGIEEFEMKGSVLTYSYQKAKY
jgi:hypothetical protein